MRIYYYDKNDLLYIRFDGKEQKVINQRITENMVLDIGKVDKIVGVEIFDASQIINLAKILPVEYHLPHKTV